MTRSARGLFRATGKRAHPNLEIIDGIPVEVPPPPREVDDFYPTPPDPVRAFLAAELPRLRSFPAVWEAAAGDGAMVREMQACGLTVVASDLVDRGMGAEIRSFYDFSTSPAPAMVTNPPFKECNSGDWITHAMDVLRLPYMALLLPFNWPGAAGRGALWAAHPPARVYLMRWRIDFTGGGASPVLNAWFVWDRQASAEGVRLLMLDKQDDGRQAGLFSSCARGQP